LDSLNGNDFFKRNDVREQAFRLSHYPNVAREHFHTRLHKQRIGDDNDK